MIKVIQSKIFLYSTAYLIAALTFSLQLLSLLRSETGEVGIDGMYFLPRLLDGIIFIRAQGFAIPWYTPSLCGGLPYFADPQSIFYSIPQLLIFFLEPFTALSLSYLLFLLLGAIALALFVKRCCGLGHFAALLTFTMILGSGYFRARAMTGQISHLPFALIPLVVYLLTEKALSTRLSSVFAGITLALMAHQGFHFAPLFIPLAGTAMLLCYWLINPAEFIVRYRTIAVRILSAALIALALSLSKIYAALAFLQNFPRHTHAENSAGFLEGLTLFASQLFLPGSYEPFEWATFEYDAGVSYAVLLAILLSLSAVSRIKTFSKIKIFPILLLITIAIVCFVISTGLFGFSQFATHLPYFSSMRLSFRTTATLIFPLCILSAWALEIASQRFSKTALFVACLILTLIPGERVRRTAAAHPEIYYGFTMQGANELAHKFKTAPLEELKFNQIGSPFPELPKNISESKRESLKKNYSGHPLATDFQSMQSGISNPTCYFPLYATGYPSVLSSGSAYHIHDQKFNFNNPSCILFPSENGCIAGDAILTSDKDNLELLLDHHNPTWQLPLAQRISNWVSTGTLGVCLLALIYYFLVGLYNFRSRI